MTLTDALLVGVLSGISGGFIGWFLVDFFYARWMDYRARRDFTARCKRYGISTEPLYEADDV